MLTLKLPDEQVHTLVTELAKAGRQEIGGIIMGKQLSPGHFTVTDMTIQRHSGMFASFIRNAQLALSALQQFFSRTGHAYRRYNYLGEWHSHPSFKPMPSDTDHATMIDVVCNQNTGANFVVLLIVRLSVVHELDATLTVYLPDGTIQLGNLVFNSSTKRSSHG